ncbi:MAG: DNA polymerase III subunit beta [Armatimonadota bacterium]
MKLTCSRKDLAEAVTAAAAAASARSAQRVLQSLKLEASKDHLRILGCDGEMWIERSIPTMVEEDGAVCVEAAHFSSIVSSLPEGEIHLDASESRQLRLTASGSEYRMPTYDAEDFPEVASFGGEAELTLTLGELKEATESVSFAVSNDAYRQLLTGVLMSYDGQTLTLVATDTHRLAVRKIEREGIGKEVNAVVPEKMLRAVRNLPVANDSSVTLKFGENRVGVESPTARVVSQLLIGTYPNWQRVVPSESTRTWKVEVGELQDRVKRALIVAKDNASRIRFKGEGDTVLISARSEDRGDAREELMMVADNGDIEIAFNGKFVLDALGPIGGAGVRVEMTEATRPAVFSPADPEKDYRCVIMPMATG